MSFVATTDGPTETRLPHQNVRTEILHSPTRRSAALRGSTAQSSMTSFCFGSSGVSVNSSRIRCASLVRGPSSPWTSTTRGRLGAMAPTQPSRSDWPACALNPVVPENPHKMTHRTFRHLWFLIILN